MRKFLTTGLFGAILGLLVGAPADASLISRGFLDEALTSYATTTALDLKADKADLTDLSDKIGTLPSGSLIGNSPAMDALFKFTQGADTPVFPNSLSDLINQLYGGNEGRPGAISAILLGFEHEVSDEYSGPVGVLPAMELSLSANTAANTALATATEAKTAADATTAKIGTLPSGDMRTSRGLTLLLPNTEYYTYPTSIGDFMGQMYSEYLGLSGLAEAVYHGNESTGQTNIALQVKGLRQITDEIGTLPSGSLLGNSPAMDALFKFTQDTDTPIFPKNLSGLINQLYGSNEGGTGAITALLNGFEHDFIDEYSGPVGVLPAMQLGISANTAAKTAQETANRARALAESNYTAIGTLPSGSLLNQTPFTDELYRFTQGTESPVYPNSMAELVKQIYGEFSSSGNQPGLVHLLITGFPHNASLPINSAEIGILPAMSLAENANSVANTANKTAQANTAKIGDLPSGRLHMRLPDLSIFASAGITEPFNYPTSLSDLFLYLFGSYEDTTKNGLFPVIGTRLGYILAQIEDIEYTSNAIQSKIGTLPRGNFPEFPAYENLFSWLNQPLTYPTSLAELITAIYGNSETVGLLAAIITGFRLDADLDADGSPDGGLIGLIPNLQSAESANDLATEAKELATTANTTATEAKTAADANTAKIGAISPNTTVSELIGETDAKIGDLPTDTTVAGMMGNPVLLNREQTIIPLSELIVLGSNGQMVLNPITEATMPFPLLGLHDLTFEVNKIGTLPTEYATVGAALTAMDAKIDARELPSTSDDGQYVLSAKKVGDTITYTWVKMDLTDEEQAQ